MFQKTSQLVRLCAASMALSLAAFAQRQAVAPPLPSSTPAIKGAVGGIVFWDLNLNLVRDANEPAVSNATVWIYGNSTVTKVTAASNGLYIRGSLKKGPYTLLAVPPSLSSWGSVKTQVNPGVTILADIPVPPAVKLPKLTQGRI